MHEEALHGYVARGATSFPQSIALASTWDPALLERVFSVAAREMRARGATLALAPVVDVARDPRWGRIEETYGEDPYLVSEMGLAAIRGFQGTTLPLPSDKVMVTLKHMTGHGQPENGTNVGPAHLGERELREIFFPPFERAVKELPVRSVMASYNEIDGVPSHANPWLLQRRAARRVGFQGRCRQRLFRDPRAGHPAQDVRQRRRMPPSARSSRASTSRRPIREGYAHLPELVRDGRVSQALVDDAVRRVLRLKFEVGPVRKSLSRCRDRRGEDRDSGRDRARPRGGAARRSSCSRTTRACFRSTPSKIRRMAVIGTHARDTPIGGYSDVPRHVVSVLEGLQAQRKGRFAVDYAEGVRLTESRCWSCDEVKLVARSGEPQA